MKNSSNQQTFRGSTLCKSNFQQPPGILAGHLSRYASYRWPFHPDNPKDMHKKNQEKWKKKLVTICDLL